MTQRHARTWLATLLATTLLGACGGGNTSSVLFQLSGSPFSFCWDAAGPAVQDVGVATINNNSGVDVTVTFSNAGGSRLEIPADLSINASQSGNVTIQANGDFTTPQSLHYVVKDGNGQALESGDITVNKVCAPVGPEDVYFDRNGEIWVVPLDGSKAATMVVQAPGIELFGVGVKPSGSLAFSYFDGVHDVPLWGSKANGTGLASERVVAGHWLQMPVFNGIRSSWSQGNDFDDGDIWYQGAGPALQLTGTPSLADGDSLNDYDPSFGMVAGVDVIFFSRHDATNTTSDIYWVSLDGTTETPVAADPAVSEDHPSYSAVNDLIVFERGVDDLSEDDLYVVDSHGNGLTQITSGPDDDDDPVWSADGKWIIFERNGTKIMRLPWPATTATPAVELADGHAPAMHP